jgi:hypothetical protein
MLRACVWGLKSFKVLTLSLLGPDFLPCHCLLEQKTQARILESRWALEARGGEGWKSRLDTQGQGTSRVTEVQNLGVIALDQDWF